MCLVMSGRWGWTIYEDIRGGVWGVWVLDWDGRGNVLGVYVFSYIIQITYFLKATTVRHHKHASTVSTEVASFFVRMTYGLSPPSDPGSHITLPTLI